MITRRVLPLLLFALLASFLASCGDDPDVQETPEPTGTGAEPGRSRRTLMVDGLERELLVFSPSATASPAPLVFVFHGHGGSADGSATNFQVHELWPEAVVSYMQGLPGIAGVGDEDATKSSWQKSPGQLDDRDVRYVEAALVALHAEFKIDDSRMYAFGHSNGARFVNVLWVSDLGAQFAAFCSSAAQGGPLLEIAEPRSLFMIMGMADTVSLFETQQRSIPIAQDVLGTDPGMARDDGLLHSEPGAGGLELVTYIHPGGHEFPPEVMPGVIAFFKRHELPD